MKWSDGDGNAERTFVIDNNVALTAEFAIEVRTIVVHAENGTILGAGRYEYGSVVTLTAIPDEGYHFVGWSDGDVATSKSITVHSDVTLTAEFAINVYSVTLNTDNGMVTGAGEYNHGDIAQLVATPNEGYHFVGWSDGDMSITRNLVITSDITLSAVISINVYDLVVNAENGIVTNVGRYEHGSVVDISAIPNAGYHFVSWSDGDSVATRTITLTSNVTLSAYFELNVYELVLEAENGVVFGAGRYSHGTEVSIAAFANEGYKITPHLITRIEDNSGNFNEKLSSESFAVRKVITGVFHINGAQRIEWKGTSYTDESSLITLCTISPSSNPVSTIESIIDSLSLDCSTISVALIEELSITDDS